MSKIKILCDSASDIPKDKAKKYNIDVLPITIIHNGKEYRDWYDFEPDEFYDILESGGEMPSTSQVTPELFMTAYEDALEKGYEGILVVTLNSSASGTYQSAVIAKGFFEEKHGKKIEITILDSGTFTYLISVGLFIAAEKFEKGETLKDVYEYLQQFYTKIKAYVAVGTLEFLIKKGRISHFSGFMGGILNIKPIVKVADTEINSVDKVRGSAAIVPKLIELAEKEWDENNYLFVIRARECPEFHELIAALKKRFPDKEIVIGNLGPVISLNIGPYIVGLGYIAK